jgi:hypothetical protein
MKAFFAGKIQQHVFIGEIMKKIFFIFLAVGIFVSTLGFTATNAHAAGHIAYEGAAFVQNKGIVFVFDVDGVAKKNTKIRDATLTIDSEVYPLSCIFKADEGKIRCDVRGGLTQFAGQTGIISLNGQTFYVIIPPRNVPVEQAGLQEEPLVCPDGEVPGADVNVSVDGGEFIEFVPGDTLAEVQSLAEDWFGEGNFEIISELYCGQAPS